MKPASDDPAQKRSFSLPASLYHRMLGRMRERGIKSESGYLQQLIREDLEAKQREQGSPLEDKLDRMAARLEKLERQAEEEPFLRVAEDRPQRAAPKR